MISHINKDGKLYLKYNNKTLAVIKKDVLLELLSADEQPTKKKVSKKQTSTTIKRAKPTARTVDSFIKNYYLAKQKFFKKKLPKPDIKATSKEYKYFKQATDLAYELEVTTKEYIKAQVDGLSFVDNGRGQFPKPMQLVGENAINRVLDYGRKVNVSEKDIELSEKDMWQKLEDNAKYQNFKKKIKSQTATLSEAYYVSKLEKHWNGKPSLEVEVYLEIMEEDKNVSS